MDSLCVRGTITLIHILPQEIGWVTVTIQRGLRIVTFKVDPPTLEALDKLASSLGVSRSDLIRKAIEILLDEYGVKADRMEYQDMPREDLITIDITL